MYTQLGYAWCAEINLLVSSHTERIARLLLLQLLRKGYRRLLNMTAARLSVHLEVAKLTPARHDTVRMLFVSWLARQAHCCLSLESQADKLPQQVTPNSLPS
jgi:hypothetical protein